MQQNLQRKWNYNHSCDKLAVIYVAACAKQDRLLTGISVGLTPAVIGESLDDALKRADKALDRSKEKGKNCYTVEWTRPGMWITSPVLFCACRDKNKKPQTEVQGCFGGGDQI